MPIQKGPANLGAGSVDSTELANTLDLSAKTVTYRSIVAGDIASNAITTAKITDANITTAKVADTAITPAKMANSGAELGSRNRIINGAMVIDQRKVGASVTPTADSTYTLDRWMARLSLASKFSVQQNAGAVTPPTGYINYLGVTSLSATTVGAGDYYGIQQSIEGLNIADFGWGTASAQTVTLSFWVRCSLTGTFSGAFKNSAFNRSYPFTFTISSANTWEQKTITVAGDTSGTWLTTSGIGVQVIFNLGYGSTYLGTAGAWAASNLGGVTGSVNVVGTNGATFFITGVQLEKGSTATSFDYRPFGTELSLCQRYFETNYPSGVATGSISLPGFVSTNSSSNSSSEASGVQFSVKKRANPTIVIYHITTGTAGQVYRVSDAASVGVTSTHIGQSGIGFLALASSSANGYYWNYTASAEL